MVVEKCPNLDLKNWENFCQFKAIRAKILEEDLKFAVDKMSLTQKIDKFFLKNISNTLEIHRYGLKRAKISIHLALKKKCTILS